MNLREAVVGTMVSTSMGIRRTGKIVERFWWSDSTDGTYKQPGKQEVAVQWFDGTRGYIDVAFLTAVDPNT